MCVCMIVSTNTVLLYCTCTVCTYITLPVCSIGEQQCVGLIKLQYFIKNRSVSDVLLHNRLHAQQAYMLLERVRLSHVM